MKKVFLAGIIQGSARDKSIIAQDYRGQIKGIIAEFMPDWEVYDPYDGHEGSVHYDIVKGEAVFRNSLEELERCDLLIAYLPSASLGTAIEMWESCRLGIPVWTITEMKDNWVVRFCSERIFANVDSFGEFLKQADKTAVKEN